MRYIIVWLFLLSSCTGGATEMQPCGQACALKQQVARLQMQKATQRKLIRKLSERVKHFEEKQDNVCEKCYCRKYELAMSDCHPMGTDNDWNVAIRGGFPGDGVVPYNCSYITGRPISKYAPAYRQLWHAKANACVLRVQDLLDDPNGRLSYRVDGVRADIVWRVPSTKLKWVPKRVSPQTH